jgi:hypothetical protein
MLGTNARRMLLLAVLAALFFTVRAWLSDAPDVSQSPDISQSDDVVVHPRDASAADSPPVVATVPHPIAVGPGASTAGIGEASVATAARPQQVDVRLAVRMPSVVEVGDTFEARIAIDATVPVRDLVLAVAHEKSALRLVSRSEGEYLRQPGLHAEYGIDEPSDGYISLEFRAVGGSFATGAGNVLVLEFEALRPGPSRIELRDVKTFGADGDANRNVAVTNASVTIR